MKLKLIFGLSLLAIGCTHAGSSNSQTNGLGRSSNVRLAQAQMGAAEGSPILGTMNFEQMPNSVIVTYRFEGLQPKGNYQISFQEGADCESLDLNSLSNLKQLRANKQGVAENTFKTQDFSVSGERALVGGAVVLASNDVKMSGASTGGKQLACGQIEPFKPSTASE